MRVSKLGACFDVGPAKQDEVGANSVYSLHEEGILSLLAVRILVVPALI